MTGKQGFGAVLLCVLVGVAGCSKNEPGAVQLAEDIHKPIDKAEQAAQDLNAAAEAQAQAVRDATGAAGKAQSKP